MKFRSIVYCVCFLLPLLTLGQTTWRNAVVTYKDGTTAKGLVNDQEWTVNPKEIEFKPEGKGEVIKLTTEVIQGFSTDRPVMYWVHSVEYDGDDQRFEKRPVTREPVSMAKDRVFLEVLVHGGISLTKMTDTKGRVHFFVKQEQDTVMTELLNRKYIIVSSVGGMGQNEKFRQQLALMANDCKDIRRRILQIRYNDTHLRQMVIKINQCKNLSVFPLWEGKTFKRPSDMGIAVSSFMNYTFYSFYVSIFTNLNVGAGIFHEKYSRNRPNRISYYNEILYKRISQDGSFHNSKKSLLMQVDRVKMINTMRFSIPGSSGGRFFCGIGMESGIRFKTFVEGWSSYPYVQDYSGEFELGPFISIGKTFMVGKKFKLNSEIRYESEQSLFKDTSFINSQNVGLSLQAAFR